MAGEGEMTKETGLAIENALCHQPAFPVLNMYRQNNVAIKLQQTYS